MKILKTALPLLMVLIVGGLYVWFESAYVDCENGNCAKIDGKMVSRVKDPLKQTNADARLANLDAQRVELSANLREKVGAVATTNVQIYQTDVDIAAENVRIAGVANTEKTKDLIGNVNENVAKLSAGKTKYEAEKTRGEYEANAVSAKIEGVAKQEDAIRKQFSDRYSNRWYWIFLSSVLVLLAFASLFCAGFVIYRSQRCFYAEAEAKRNTCYWLIVPTIVSAIMLIAGYRSPESFGSITLDLIKTNLKEVNEISLASIGFFVTVTFVCSIFLITASCALSWAGTKVKEQKPPPTKDAAENEIQPTQKEIDELHGKIYASLLRHLRTVLYVGTCLLLVGILRLGYMHEWYLAFVPETKNTLSPVLKASKEVQGALYSIMLAAIYLVPVYWIREESMALSPPAEDKDKKDLEFSYKDILLKLLVVLSPFLAGSYGGVVDYFK